jgi:primosomal protein N' (replication factor Y)
MCHYCGFSMPKPDDCPECGGRLKFVGAGTQKVEEELGELFPGVGIVRMDADTVSLLGSHQKLLGGFRANRTPILLGTQMVTKGLDFENVTLVGVLSADQSLYVNDYRAHERAFSLITQVIGRSGRGEKTGRAVIQTYTPESEVISLAAKQDYDGFYDREILFRSQSGTPPIRDILSVTATGLDETNVLKGAVRLRNTIEGYLADMENVTVLGPAPAAVAKVNNRYRYKISVLCENNKRIRETIAHTAREFARDGKNRGVSVYADIDPFE